MSNNKLFSVVILSHNEELNLPYAIRSVNAYSDDIHVVDDGSEDNSREIAAELDAKVWQNPWTNWADQRNWAIVNCNLKYAWVLFLDADEQLTDQAFDEISTKLDKVHDNINAFYLNFNYFFLGKLLHKAMNPHLRLIRTGHVTWTCRGAKEYCSASSDSPSIKARLIHKDQRGINFFIEKQSQNALIEAQWRFQNRSLKKPSILMLFVPFIRFAHRILFRTSIRDGLTGLLAAFLFGFWHPLLIEIYYIELFLKKGERK